MPPLGNLIKISLYKGYCLGNPHRTFITRDVQIIGWFSTSGEIVEIMKLITSHLPLSETIDACAHIRMGPPHIEAMTSDADSQHTSLNKAPYRHMRQNWHATFKRTEKRSIEGIRALILNRIRSLQYRLQGLWNLPNLISVVESPARSEWRVESIPCSGTCLLFNCSAPLRVELLANSSIGSLRPILTRFNVDDHEGKVSV